MIGRVDPVEAACRIRNEKREEMERLEWFLQCTRYLLGNTADDAGAMPERPSVDRAASPRTADDNVVWVDFSSKDMRHRKTMA